MNKNKDKKILIIDDEREMVEELTEILEREGYAIEVAFDGEEAIERFRDPGQDIGLVLLDVKMPKMSGVEVYRKIRKIDAHVPVIIVTGSFEKKHADQILKEGAHMVVSKPFEVEKLLRLIKKLRSEHLELCKAY